MDHCDRRLFFARSMMALAGASLRFGMAGGGAVAAGAPSTRPNILLIVSDDQGWGDLPANGAETNVRMPVLDRLAREGVRFCNFHTEPLCGPSRACLFTGQYSMENGMWRGLGQHPPGDPNYRGVKRDVKMLSQFLKEAGYATGALGKWHLGELPGECPNDRGFDEFYGFLGGAHPYRLDRACRLVHNGQPYNPGGHTTEVFTDQALEFVRANVGKARPFFCYLAYNAVHGPLWSEENPRPSAPDEWLKRAEARGIDFPRRDYVAILEHMDYNIGRVMALLKELKIDENTLVVFVSDNGACLMTGETAGHYPGNNGPLRGGKGTTWQGGLNVPFIMRWKGRFPEDWVSDAVIMHCDVFSTLLSAADRKPPAMNGKNPVRGMSLLPHVLSRGKETIPERSMFFELTGNIGMRKGKYKLWGRIESSHADWKRHVAELEKADLQLFDLTQDVGERRDLRTQIPELYASLKRELIDYFSSINAEYPAVPAAQASATTTPAPMSRDERRKLREERVNAREERKSDEDE